METSKETKRIVKKHLSCFLKQDIEGLMELYSDKTVIVGYGKSYRGLKAIRKLMEDCIAEWFGGNGKYGFDVTFETFSGSHGYIEIKGYNHVYTIVFGNSSYMVENGKIVYESAGRYVTARKSK